jgi:hypothetical protein
MAYQGGRDPAEADAELQRQISDAESEIHKHVQELHDQGVINLDAPAREVIDVIQKRFPQGPEKAAEGAQGEALARAGGYWLVGDQGWCNHLN